MPARNSVRPHYPWHSYKQEYDAYKKARWDPLKLVLLYFTQKMRFLMSSSIVDFSFSFKY